MFFLQSKTKKAQTTPEGLLIVLVEIIIFMAINPVLEDVIGNIQNTTTSSTVALVVGMYPLMFALVIMITLLIYTSVRRG